MFKLPQTLSSRPCVNELADFSEWLAWTRGKVSAREILAALGRLDENDVNVGCDDNADDLAAELDEVMNEIERRSSACDGAYPFALGLQGTVLFYAPPKDPRATVYCYLLMGTRLNMQANRTHAQIDGALLFEELGAHVLGNYLGGQAVPGQANRRRAKSLVFGTGNPGSFAGKVADLCTQLGEGGAFRKLDDADVDAQDDKLDVIAWVPFSDQKRSQLILFGQCKTGTSWDGQKTQLQPDAFVHRWMRDPFLMMPMRVFMITEASDRAQWCGDSLYAGLFFDRCRIIDFSENLDDKLLARIGVWTDAAKLNVTTVN